LKGDTDWHELELEDPAETNILLQKFKHKNGVTTEEIEADKFYNFKISAENRVGKSPEATISNVHTVGEPAPVIAVNLSYGDSSTDVTVKFTSTEEDSVVAADLDFEI